MGRSKRMVVPGRVLLIKQRGDNRQAVFFSAPDYKRYIDALKVAARTWSVAIHAYALMADHVYLLVTPRDRGGPSRMMQCVGRRYVCSGTLWGGPYQSSLVDADRYLLLCSRYLETEPVRAGVVAHPRAYPWTSHRHNAFGELDPVITAHAAYAGLGASPERRAAAYRALFETPLSQDEIDAVYVAAETGAVLGDEHFRDRMAAQRRRRVTRYGHSGNRGIRAFRER